jgi:hypothetical protein
MSTMNIAAKLRQLANDADRLRENIFDTGTLREWADELERDHKAVAAAWLLLETARPLVMHLELFKDARK